MLFILNYVCQTLELPCTTAVKLSSFAWALYGANPGFLVLMAMLAVSLALTAVTNIMYQVINLSFLSLIVVASWMYVVGVNFTFLAYILAFVGAVIMLFLSIVMMLPSSVIAAAPTFNFSPALLLFFLAALASSFVPSATALTYLLGFATALQAAAWAFALNLLLFLVHKESTGNLNLIKAYRFLIAYYRNAPRGEYAHLLPFTFPSSFGIVIHPFLMFVARQKGWPTDNFELIRTLISNDISAARPTRPAVLWYLRVQSLFAATLIRTNFPVNSVGKWSSAIALARPLDAQTINDSLELLEYHTVVNCKDSTRLFVHKLWALDFKYRALKPETTRYLATAGSYARLADFVNRTALFPLALALALANTAVQHAKMHFVGGDASQPFSALWPLFKADMRQRLANLYTLISWYTIQAGSQGLLMLWATLAVLSQTTLRPGAVELRAAPATPAAPKSEGLAAIKTTLYEASPLALIVSVVVLLVALIGAAILSRRGIKDKH